MAVVQAKTGGAPGAVRAPPRLQCFDRGHPCGAHHWQHSRVPQNMPQSMVAAIMITESGNGAETISAASPARARSHLRQVVVALAAVAAGIFFVVKGKRTAKTQQTTPYLCPTPTALPFIDNLPYAKCRKRRNKRAAAAGCSTSLSKRHASTDFRLCLRAAQSVFACVRRKFRDGLQKRVQE
jgi:hypothetical protein